MGTVTLEKHEIHFKNLTRWYKLKTGGWESDWKMILTTKTEQKMEEYKYLFIFRLEYTKDFC